MEKNYLFKFLEYALVVILTVLLMETSKSIIYPKKTPSTFNDFINNYYRFILQLLTLLIFLELYIVLYTYHTKLGVPYRCAFLFFDLFFISLPFIILVQIINESWTRDELLKMSIGMLAFLFLVIFLRQGFCYMYTPSDKTVPIDLKISMFADLFGIVMCYLAYYVFPNIKFWSCFGFGAFTFYFILTRVITLTISVTINQT